MYISTLYLHMLSPMKSSMKNELPQVNCSIGYEPSGMGEALGLCGIDSEDDTRGGWGGAVELGECHQR